MAFLVGSTTARVVTAGQGDLQRGGYISIFNQAGYVIDYVVTWMEPTIVSGVTIPIPKVHTRQLSLGFTDDYVIPANATNIVLNVTPVGVLSQYDNLNLSKLWNTAGEANACYKVYGTVFSAESAEVSCTD